MDKLRKAEQELYEQIESLSMSIKSQRNTLDTWDENNPIMLDKEMFKESLRQDRVKILKLKFSYRKLLDQMKQEILKM